MSSNTSHQATILTALRPHHWVHFLLFPAAGLYISQGALPAGPLAAAVAAAALLLAYAFGLNQYMDGGQRLSPWWHRGPLLLLPGAAWLLPAPGGVAAILFAIISGVYSAGPRLKGYPVVGTLLNATGFPLLCLLGVAELDARVLSLVGLAVSWLGAAQLVHELSHEEADRRTGLRTTAMVLGPGWSRSAAVLLLLATALASLPLGPLFFWSLLGNAAAVALLAVWLPPAPLRITIKLLGLLWAGSIGLSLLT